MTDQDKIKAALEWIDESLFDFDGKKTGANLEALATDYRRLISAPTQTGLYQRIDALVAEVSGLVEQLRAANARIRELEQRPAENGKKGGEANTEAQRQARAANGAKGGRPQGSRNKPKISSETR